jgi:hypothetical protein
MWDTIWIFIYDLRYRNTATAEVFHLLHIQNIFPSLPILHFSTLNLASNPPFTERRAGTTQKPLQLYSFFLFISITN